VDKLVDAWNDMLGHNTPSVHVFERENIVVISSTSGCLMRPLSVLDDLECVSLASWKWVDSTVFNSRVLHRGLNISPKITMDPLECSRTQALLFPYLLHNMMPRPTLASIMSTQAICCPNVSLMYIIRPNFMSLPVVRTPLMDLVCRSCTEDSYFNVPGVDLVVLFANFMDTYEDSVIMSSLVNDYGLFDTRVANGV
jgi:hypothetical protein